MTAPPEKCPGCGAPIFEDWKDGFVQWKCMSFISSKDKAFRQHEACKDVELAALREQLTRQFVWTDDATPFDAQQVRDLLKENAWLREQLEACIDWLDSGEDPGLLDELSRKLRSALERRIPASEKDAIITSLREQLARARDGLSGVKFEKSGREYKTPWATVWENGTWHTWNADGVGGENGNEKSVQDAMAWATFTALRQGFILQHTELARETLNDLRK